MSESVYELTTSNTYSVKIADQVFTFNKITRKDVKALSEMQAGDDLAVFLPFLANQEQSEAFKEVFENLTIEQTMQLGEFFKSANGIAKGE